MTEGVKWSEPSDGEQHKSECSQAQIDREQTTRNRCETGAAGIGSTPGFIAREQLHASDTQKWK